MKQFQQKRPAGFVDLMIAFESRKRGKFSDISLFGFININIINSGCFMFGNINLRTIFRMQSE